MNAPKSWTWNAASGAGANPCLVVFKTNGLGVHEQNSGTAMVQPLYVDAGNYSFPQAGSMYGSGFAIPYRKYFVHRMVLEMTLRKTSDDPVMLMWKLDNQADVDALGWNAGTSTFDSKYTSKIGIPNDTTLPLGHSSMDSGSDWNRVYFGRKSANDTRDYITKKIRISCTPFHSQPEQEIDQLVGTVTPGASPTFANPSELTYLILCFYSNHAVATTDNAYISLASNPMSFICDRMRLTYYVTFWDRQSLDATADTMT